MWIIRAMLLGGAALGAVTCTTMADDAVDLDKLAGQATPVLPSGSRIVVISRTAPLEVPGLPMTTKEKLREGPNATTLRILPATGVPADSAVSWSGYTRAGAVYHGSN